ncbi:MAG: pyridoxamine 5'-phosphate oxidase family protein, partial [Chromatiales bacterium]|nr:pyridoxamine 5'-phosphate oxidase family protein [Chromatiales bacterium]
MGDFYGHHHRQLQDKFETRRLANRLESVSVRHKLKWADTLFIQARDLFLLSSIDHRGRPTVSYKGGEPGFVRVVDEMTLAFPSYDGNGMFYSMGNILGNPEVGLLFIDFGTPQRLRIQGRASILVDDPLRETFPGAELVVRVTVDDVFPNCPRYVHKYEKVAESPYIPRETQEAPVPEWKRLDIIQDALPARDQEKTDALGGTISRAEYSD